MARVLLYYAHPGQRHSQVNARMFEAASAVDGITTIDLYRAYPRFDIDIDAEQRRLQDHDVILFQYPVFWYSSPALVKEWLDLVLEHGFAYGDGGTQLSGKTLMLALTAAGAQDAYTNSGYQHFPLRTFLTPMEQTATLCKMTFAPPYVLYGALRAAETDEIDPHVAGYRHLLEALRDDRFDGAGAATQDVLTHHTLPFRQDA